MKFLLIYVPNLRFAGYIDNYRTCKLIDISEIVTRTNENNSEYPIMMISAGKGFIAQSEKYSRDNAGTSINKYILLKKGELAYNRGNSKQFPYGAIYEMKEECALIPYVYHCFNIYDESTRYFSHYLNSPFKDEQLSKIITSSVRGNGLLNISKNDFFNLSLNVPSIKEQNKIAKFLDLIDQRIQTQSKIIDSYFSLSKAISNTLIGQSKGNTRLRECLNCYSSNTMESVIKQEDLGDYPVYGANGIIKKINNYEIEYPSIAIVKDGSGVGKMFKLSGKYSILSTLNYLTSKPGYDIDYIYYALKQKSLKKYVVGSGIPHIYFKDYEQEKIYIPQNELQQQNITSVLQSIDEEIGNEIKQLKNYELLKKYLLKNMFV